MSTQQVLLITCRLNAFATSLPGPHLSIGESPVQSKCALEQSSFNSRPPFPASMLSIRIASMLFTCCFEASNLPIFHSRPVCYLYILPVCYLYAASKFQTTQSSIPGQYAIYMYCQYAIYMFFEASNLPIFHSWPVCYLYVLPVCYLHAASKLRTTQSSIPGQYAIYTYCQYAIYMLLRSFEPPNLPFLASMLSIRIASMLFTCCFEASNHPIFHSWPVCYLYVLPVCYLHAVSKLRTTQSSIPGQYAIYTYCQYAIYMLLRSFEPPNLPFLASMLSIRIASMLFTCCFEASNHPIFQSRPVCYLYVFPVYYLYAASKLRTTQSSIPGQYAIYTYFQYTIYMLLRSFEPPNLLFPASILSIPIDSMLFTCCFEPPNLPFLASMLSIRIASMLFTCCFEPPNLPFLASMLSIRIASMLFICCFEASNHPIFYSRPVCYLYVLPVCYLYAASKLRTTQSSIPGQYAIYTYCQYAIYMLLRTTQSSIPGQYAIYMYCQYAIYMLLRTTQSSIPGQYAVYTYCQYAIYMLLRSFEPPNLLFPASMLSIRIASMLFTCCFEASNHPIFYSRPVCYLYVLPVCYLYAASKLRTTQSSIPGQYAIYTYCQYAIYMLLRTTQSSIPGQYAIYTYCQYAIYMLLRSFEPPNLLFPASMLSIRIASMLFTCCFEPPNLPFLASMLSIRIASMLFTCCFEPPNLPFLASMLSIRIASMLFICCFEASNHPIFYSRPVCYLYVLPVCYLHAVSKLRTTQSSIPGQYAIYTYCQYAIYMLFRSFEPPNHPFPASIV